MWVAEAVVREHAAAATARARRSAGARAGPIRLPTGCSVPAGPGNQVAACVKPMVDARTPAQASGIETQNVVPAPASAVTAAWPPCASAIEATIDSPRPAPPMARERALSTR